MNTRIDTRRLAVETALDIEVDIFRAGSSMARGFYLVGTLDGTRMKIHRYVNDNLDGLDIEVLDNETGNYVPVMGEYVPDKSAAKRLLPERLNQPGILAMIVSMYEHAAAEIDGRVENYVNEITDDVIEQTIIEFETKGVRA